MIRRLVLFDSKDGTSCFRPKKRCKTSWQIPFGTRKVSCPLFCTFFQYIYPLLPMHSSIVSFPGYCVPGVITAAKRSPELVHLLQLQSYFPQASMAGIVRALPSGATAHGASRPSLEESLKSLGSTLSESRGVAEVGVAGPKTRDASTETPTHFVERHIDPRYHWNEWDMRRKMLRYADIKNSRTVSVQSHISFFRRENDTQVYLPKESGTQTGISTGTNPIRVVRYIEGSQSSVPAFLDAVFVTAVLSCVCVVLCTSGLRGRAPVVSSEAGPSSDPGVRVASYTIDTA